jgi:hypothetical protein
MHIQAHARGRGLGLRFKSLKTECGSLVSGVLWQMVVVVEEEGCAFKCMGGG